MKKFEQMLFLINVSFMIIEMVLLIVKLEYMPSLSSCTIIYLSVAMIIIDFIFLMVEILKRPEDF